MLYNNYVKVFCFVKQEISHDDLVLFLLINLKHFMYSFSFSHHFLSEQRNNLLVRTIAPKSSRWNEFFFVYTTSAVLFVVKI